VADSWSAAGAMGAPLLFPVPTEREEQKAAGVRPVLEGSQD